MTDRGRTTENHRWAAVSVCCLLAVIGLSCSENNCCCPDIPPPTSGRVVVESIVRTDQDGSWYTSGFSFSEGEVVRVPNSEGVLPDLIVLVHIIGDGQVVGVYFGGMPDTESGFHHIGSADTLGEAQTTFDSTTCLPEGVEFERTAFPGQPYDVLGVRTNDGRFAKVLVVDAFAFEFEYVRAGTTFVRYYGEATFDWVFQPDGGRCFN